MNSVKKQLLVKSAMALGFAALAAAPNAQAAWTNPLAGNPTTTQTASANGQTLGLTGTDTITTTNAVAASSGNFTGLILSVNDTSAANGISSTGDFSTVAITGTGALNTLNNTSGTITGTGLATSGNATVLLGGAANTTTITNAAPSTISNTANGGATIMTSGANKQTVTINNAGTISATNNAGSIAIDVAGTGGSSVALNNTGTVSAGANGTAVNVLAGNSATVANSGAGSITGALTANGTGTLTVTNSGTATIAGNITGGTGAVSVTNSGTGAITGNVNLGTAATSTLVLSGTGGVTGNVQMGNAGQLTTLSGGAVSGTINGPGNLVVATNTAQGGAIGGTTALTKITVNDGDTLTGAAGAAIKADSIVLGSGSAGNAGLTLNTGVVTGSIDGNAAGNGVLTFNANNTLAAASNIGANNALKTVTINNGFTVDDSAANDTIKATNVTIGSGSTLKLGTGTVTATNGINGTAAGNGTLEFAGSQTNASAIGNTAKLNVVKVDNGATVANTKNITANTITVGGGTSGALNQSAGTITGAVGIAAGGTLGLSGTGNVVGAIDGTGAGTGTLNLANTLVETGTNTVGGTNGLAAININNGGALTINNNTGSTLTTVNNGGTLTFGSTGKTLDGAVTANSGGIVDVGHGTNTTTGVVNTQSGSTIAVTEAGGTFGKLTTGGSNTIVSGTKLGLTVADTGANGTALTNGTYTLVDGSGASATRILNSNLYINGTQTTDTGLITITSTSNAAAQQDVAVTVTRRALNAATGQTSNETAVVNAINGSAAAGLAATKTRLNNYNTASSLNSAAEELTPESDNSITQGVYQTTTQAMDILQTRLENARDDGKSSGDTNGAQGVFAEGFGSWASQDNRDGVQGYDADTYGFIVGADKQLGGNSRVGISANYARTNVDSNDNNKTNDIDTYQVNLFGTHDFGNNFYADGIAGFAWNHFDTERDIPGAGARAEGDFNGQTYLARIGGGYRYYVGKTNFDITPTVNLTYAHSDFDDYTEKGAGALNLRVSNDSVDILEPRVGVKAGYTFKSDTMRIRPEVRASYGYDVIGDNQVTQSTFTGTTATFRTEGADAQQGGLDVGAGIDLISHNNVTVSADYDYQVKKDFDDNSALVRIRYDF